MGNICGKTQPVKQVLIKANKKKAIPKALKRAVWDKYVGEDVGKTLCLCCNHVYIRQIEFHCGHVIAEAKGGETTIENMRPICAQCNLSMGTTNMVEFKKMFELKKK